MKQRPDRIPGTIEDIDIEWLSESLGAPIEAFEKRFLEGGVLTDAFRVHGIRYATETHDAPSSVVVKLPTRDTLRREMAIENGAYIRELNFFREIAHDMPLRSPLVYEAPGRTLHAEDGARDCSDARKVLGGPRDSIGLGRFE
jgi:hypothetical protein